MAESSTPENPTTDGLAPGPELPAKTPAELLRERSERTLAKFAEPELLDTICDYVCNGGSVIELCKLWDVHYHRVVRWLYDVNVPARKSQYESALVARSEWVRQRILDELRTIGLLDIRGAFDAQGNLLPPEEWPEDIARNIAAVQVFEEYQGKGEKREFVGFTKKLKVFDKLRALELLGKNEKMFSEKVQHEHHHTFSLEKMVAESLKELPAPPVQKVIEATATPVTEDEPL